MTAHATVEDIDVVGLRAVADVPLNLEPNPQRLCDLSQVNGIHVRGIQLVRHNRTVVVVDPPNLQASRVAEAPVHHADEVVDVERARIGLNVVVRTRAADVTNQTTIDDMPARVEALPYLAFRRSPNPQVQTETTHARQALEPFHVLRRNRRVVRVPTDQASRLARQTPLVQPMRRRIRVAVTHQLLPGQDAIAQRAMQLLPIVLGELVRLVDVDQVELGGEQPVLIVHTTHDDDRLVVVLVVMAVLTSQNTAKTLMVRVQDLLLERNHPRFGQARSSLTEDQDADARVGLTQIIDVAANDKRLASTSRPF